jgi:anti-anti-sigma factor
MSFNLGGRSSILGYFQPKNASSGADSDLLMSFSYSSEHRRQRSRGTRSGVIDAIEDSTQFRIETQPFGTTLVVRLVGELDLASVAQLDLVLRQADGGVNTLILDLEPLTFIDCTGLHAVFDLWEFSRRNGFNLQIVGARGVVRRVLHLTRLEDELPLVDEPSPAP